MNLSLILVNINSILLINSLNSNLIQTNAPLTSASSVATSTSIGNVFTGTTINSTATATQGNMSGAQTTAGATTNNLNNQITANVVADATKAKLVNVQNYKDQNETLLDISAGTNGIYSKTIKSNIYETNSTHTTCLDDQQMNNNYACYQDNLYTSIKSSNQNITQSNKNSAAIKNTSQNSDSTTTLDESDKIEILINIDAGSENIIVEKIIGGDRRVLIISAAKYLTGFPQTVKDQFMKMYNQKCNCRKLREWAIDLLAEGN